MTVREHGVPAWKAAVLHGGPGGAGEAGPLARAMAACGIATLEPLQSAHSVDGQVEELRMQLAARCDGPVDIVGWSWGAWLGCWLAARHPAMVRRLILVGCAPFEEVDLEGIMALRLSRLSLDEARELQSGPSGGDISRMLALLKKADSFDPDDAPPPPVAFDPALHAAVWGEAKALRRNGDLLREVERIRCPVIAIHGDHDPHPAEGVRRPLAERLADVRFHRLENCGHAPWVERQARALFLSLLEEIVSER
ncbi:alpha/beta fold hydrolase [Tropicimonas aquimaris]|uniref:Alpha/beta fold hydrolase n=1 Tax=Tropicimonas aquimaris TaxID=914152 RepID=A0ABW3IT98_9RHOB